MKNPKLILAFFWPLKLIETLITYFNDKIKPKPSPDGTLSPNTIFFSDGLYCTVVCTNVDRLGIRPRSCIFAYSGRALQVCSVLFIHEPIC